MEKKGLPEKQPRDVDELEHWKPAPELSRWNTYEVSSLGRIRLILRNGQPKAVNPKFHSSAPCIQQQRDGKTVRFMIAEVVANAFIGARPAEHRIEFIDGNKGNVAAGNLRYVHVDSISHADCHYCATHQKGEIATRAYAAGLLDGEGNLSITRRKKNERAEHLFRVSVINTDLRIMEWMVQHFGGKYYTREHENPRHRTTYNWRLNNKRAAAFLEHVLPFLVIKGEQADICISLQKSLNRYWLKRVRANSHLTPEEVGRRNALFERIKELTL